MRSAPVMDRAVQDRVSRRLRKEAAERASLRPWRVVLGDPAPALREGRGSVLGPDTSRRTRWWEMRLECGHTVERIVHYRPVPNPDRGGTQHRRRSDVLPPPRRVRCEFCHRLEDPASDG